MWFKKFFPLTLAALCVLFLLTTAAFAHGCHGSARQTRSARCGVCTVEGCERLGRHTHGRTTYCGYDHEDGYCDGTCLPLCTVEGCTLTGRHSHNGVTCCGYDHACGFCDGSCPVYGSTSSRGHHSGSHGAHH
ncbi:MAG: hypothetical protein K2O11_00920 [Oscillospiraceae bacterium]|nr:hypothetical protein [Oscillospiraceae bacterium]